MILPGAGLIFSSYFQNHGTISVRSPIFDYSGHIHLEKFKKVQVAAAIGLDYHYQVKEMWSLYSSVHYSRSLFNRLASGPVDSYANNAFLSIGLGYHLGQTKIKERFLH